MAEQITTAEALDALPPGSLVRIDDEVYEHIWSDRQVNGGVETWRCLHDIGPDGQHRTYSAATVLSQYGPLTLLFRPDASADDIRRATDLIRAEAASYGAVDRFDGASLSEDSDMPDEMVRRLVDAGLIRPDAPALRRAQRFDQCDDTCTTDCGHCKGAGRPTAEALAHNPVVRGCIVITTPPLPAYLLRDDITCPACDATGREITIDQIVTAVAQHDREVKAAALREMAARVRAEWAPGHCPWVGALDDEANRIERGEGL